MGQNFIAGLDQSLRPARLLSFKRGHLNRQFSGALDILKIDEFPSLELGAIGKVGVLGQGVVLPATRFVNRPATPDSGRAVEVEEDSAAGAPGMLEHKVPIKQDRFHLREKRIVAVNVGPASLHQSNLSVGKVMDRLQKKIFRGRKVRIEDGYEFSL